MPSEELGEDEYESDGEDKTPAEPRTSKKKRKHVGYAEVPGSDDEQQQDDSDEEEYQDNTELSK